MQVHHAGQDAAALRIDDLRVRVLQVRLDLGDAAVLYEHVAGAAAGQDSVLDKQLHTLCTPFLVSR